MIKQINRFINTRVRFVYIMACIRYPYRAKIGISTSPKMRREQITESIQQETGKEVTLKYIAFPFLMWGKTEQRLLNLTAWIYAKADMPGSGRTEWRWYLNIVTALLLSLFAKEMPAKGEIWRFVVIMLIPVPLDFVLLVAVAFILEIAVVFGIVWAGWFLFHHLQF